MKSFFQRRAGATFFQGDTISMGIRRHHVEYAFQMTNGWYGIVNMTLTPDGVILFTCWNDALEKLERMIPGLTFRESEMPLMRSILSGKCDNAGICSFASPEDGTDITVLATQVKCNSNRHIIEIAGYPEVLDRAERLLATSLDLFHELRKSGNPLLATLTTSM